MSFDLENFILHASSFAESISSVILVLEIALERHTWKQFSRTWTSLGFAVFRDFVITEPTNLRSNRVQSLSISEWTKFTAKKSKKTTFFHFFHRFSIFSSSITRALSTWYRHILVWAREFEINNHHRHLNSPIASRFIVWFYAVLSWLKNAQKREKRHKKRVNTPISWDSALPNHSGVSVFKFLRK